MDIILNTFKASISTKSFILIVQVGFIEGSFLSICLSMLGPGTLRVEDSIWFCYGYKHVAFISLPF